MHVSKYLWCERIHNQMVDRNCCQENVLVKLLQTGEKLKWDIKGASKGTSKESAAKRNTSAKFGHC